MRKLPNNWVKMTEDEQDAWGLERHLSEQFPELTIKVTTQPFRILINEDGADTDAVCRSADKWYYLATGGHIKWGNPIHIQHGKTP
jgi:hypothetical protein